MIKLTIFSPAYNRAHTLPRLYDSLCKQTNKDFEWIITDDGSTDGTDKLVMKWIEEANEFPIIYNRLEHVGIPRALNSGVSRSSTEWFMMLDSDDYILPETVFKVLCWIKEIENNDSFAGVGFARCFPNGDYMKPQTPIMNENGFIDATNIERSRYHIDMDMCEVQRVGLLKKYPFQCWKTESYAPEQLNYNAIALAGYKLRWRAEKLYVCDYLPDGQTKDDKLVKRNPMGFAMMYNQNILLSNTIKEKVVNIIRMTALAIYAKHPCFIFSSNAKVLSLLLFPFSFLLSLRRQKQYNRLGD